VTKIARCQARKQTLIGQERGVGSEGMGQCKARTTVRDPAGRGGRRRSKQPSFRSSQSQKTGSSTNSGTLAAVLLLWREHFEDLHVPQRPFKCRGCRICLVGRIPQGKSASGHAQSKAVREGQAQHIQSAAGTAKEAMPACRLRPHRELEGSVVCQALGAAGKGCSN
jgi:hypothetical protein